MLSFYSYTMWYMATVHFLYFSLSSIKQKREKKKKRNITGTKHENKNCNAKMGINSGYSISSDFKWNFGTIITRVSLIWCGVSTESGTLEQQHCTIVTYHKNSIDKCTWKLFVSKVFWGEELKIKRNSRKNEEIHNKSNLEFEQTEIYFSQVFHFPKKIFSKVFQKIFVFLYAFQRYYCRVVERKNIIW